MSGSGESFEEGGRYGDARYRAGARESAARGGQYDDERGGDERRRGGQYDDERGGDERRRGGQYDDERRRSGSKGDGAGRKSKSGGEGFGSGARSAESAGSHANAGRRRGHGRSDHNAQAPFEESYRVVRSNLLVALGDFKRPRIIVTSANAGEGKTVTCANLAVSFARAGQRVVLVDLDLRHPDAHRMVGAHNRYGVCDLLLGRRSLESCLQYLQLPGLDAQSAQGVYFIGTGPPVRNPTELLGMARTSAMLDELGKQADLILIDAPPVLPVADMLVIGRIVTGVIVVVEARRTTVTDITKTKDLLIRNQTRIFGVVLNKARARDGSYRDTYGYGTPLPADEASPNGTYPSRNGKAGSPSQHRSRSGRR